MVFSPTTKTALIDALKEWYSNANGWNENNKSWTDKRDIANGLTGKVYQLNPNTWDVRGTEGYRQVGNGYVSNRITDMSELFKDGAKSPDGFPPYVYHPDISTWNISHAANFKGMFQDTTFNGDISTKTINKGQSNEYIAWLFQNQYTSVQEMFKNNTEFNGNIGNWNMGSMSGEDSVVGMFEGATAFDQDISTKEQVSIGTTQDSFQDSNIEYTPWNMAFVLNMDSMFKGATLFNQDIGNWSTFRCTNMANMFSGATSFNQKIVSKWTNGCLLYTSPSPRD